MKIGIDARLWNETGVGRYTRNLVYNLAEIDKTNTYVLFVQSGFTINDVRLQNEQWRIIETDIRWHSLAEQVKFPLILHKEKLDLVHFPYFSLPIFYVKPFVVTIHDLIIYHFSTGKASTLPLPFYHLKRFGYQRVLAHAVTHAKKIIVPLNSVKKDLAQTLHVPEKKITVTYEGVDVKIRSKITGQRSKFQVKSQKYFLYVGNAYPHKNLERLIGAFILFKQNAQDHETQLVLVGKEDYFYKQLHRFIAERNISDVQILHTVTDAELSSLYAHALAFVSTSLMEGFGLPALEAMAHECPVLLSDIPAFHEVCQNTALYFSPGNIQEIAERMQQMSIKGKDFYKPQLENAVKRANSFSWKKMAEETLKIYNHLTI